jgi:osmotically-inducible protein OsmY
MTLQDTRLRRLIQKELVKRSVDTALINVFVTNGVVTLQGELRNQRGYAVDLRQEIEIILDVVRGMRGVRDIVNWTKVQTF